MRSEPPIAVLEDNYRCHQASLIRVLPVLNGGDCIDTWGTYSHVQELVTGAYGQVVAPHVEEIWHESVMDIFFLVMVLFHPAQVLYDVK